jgi:hypothetical protein
MVWWWWWCYASQKCVVRTRQIPSFLANKTSTLRPVTPHLGLRETQYESKLNHTVPQRTINTQRHITSQESNIQIWKYTKFRYIHSVTPNKDSTWKNNHLNIDKCEEEEEEEEQSGQKWVALLLSSHEIPSSNLGPETGYSDKTFVGFLSPCRQTPRQCLKFGRDSFLPNPFQFIIHNATPMLLTALLGTAETNTCSHKSGQYLHTTPHSAD